MKNLKLKVLVTLMFIIMLPIIDFEISISYLSEAVAQIEDQCTEQLDQAEQEHQLGNWDEAISLINNCLKKPNLSESEKGRAYRILGLTYIATQLEKEANEAVKNLLIMVPNYKIDPDRDPPALKKIVDNMAQTLHPKISSITPNSVMQGENGFTLQVTGENFVYGSSVRLDGTTKATTYVSSTELKADIPDSDILKEGEYKITVYSPILGGKTSNSENFIVKKSSAFPWTWIAAGAGAVAAGVAAILLLSNGNGDEEEIIADPPGRP